MNCVPFLFFFIRTRPLASRLALLFIKNTEGRHRCAVFVSSITQQVIEAWAWHETNRQQQARTGRGTRRDKTGNGSRKRHARRHAKKTARRNGTHNETHTRNEERGTETTGRHARRDEKARNGTTSGTKNEKRNETSGRDEETRRETRRRGQT